ncbi:hypothetical protein [Legionella spiritensis]|uniref:Peptidase C58 YopT-type domain-containing protein n=1 Tax=Legionella spiritensis TaxID=452 RepID=A0A0W0ZAF5_LEGSP|nr:hypothetical protein [Legionella spiritensis]KTD66114.1 hypothetical protein Lspi_0177 [Legionella spiritensis]SNV44101.1 Uncharacterised protein [Legionella spiritensis]
MKEEYTANDKNEILFSIEDISESEHDLTLKINRHIEDNERKDVLLAFQQARKAGFFTALKSRRNHNELLVSFNQDVLIDQMKKQRQENPEQLATLHQFYIKYDGFCELISNYVIMNGLLGGDDETDTLSDIMKMETRHVKNPLKCALTLTKINQNEVKQSHILKVSSLFQRFIAYFFEIYPHSIMPAFAKVMNNNQVNRPLLAEKLDAMEKGSYIKFFAFSKKGFLGLEGHSMVIKKTGDDAYSFFDPNSGEEKKLGIKKLADRIDTAIVTYEATRIAFIDGQRYVQDLDYQLSNDVNSDKEAKTYLKPI